MKEEQRNLFDIDPNHLDEEWLSHCKLFAQYADELAEARADQEEAKAALELKYAQLDIDIRKSPTQYGLERATEKCIESAAICNEDYQELLKELHEVRRRTNHLQAALEFLEHRKKALENLVALRLKDYFSEPSLNLTKKVRLK